MRLRLIHKGLILVSVPLLLCVAIVAPMFGLIIQNDHQRADDARHRHMSQNASRSMMLLHDTMVCVEKIVLKNYDPGQILTDTSSVKQRFKDNIEALKQIRDESYETEPDLAARTTWKKFEGMMDAILDQIRLVISSVKDHHFSLDSLAEIQHLRKDMTLRLFDMTSQAYAISDGQLQYLEKSMPLQKLRFQQQMALLLGGVIGSIFIGFMLAYRFSKDVTSRLRVLTDNTVRMARDDVLNPPLGGEDEIASLDHGFHEMADALRAAIAREHALFESASDIMCVADSNFRLTAINPAFTRLLGVEKERAIGVDLLQLVVDDDVARTRQKLQATKSGEPAITLENRLRRQQGEPIDLLWSVYWSSLDNALYAVAHDISERKKVERMKEEFLAMVSHDLRSPLSSIFGTFKLVLAKAFGEVPATAGERIQAVTANVNRLLGLINDLLDIEKLEAGKLELTPQSTDIADLLKRAVSEIEPVAGEKQVKIKVDCRCRQFVLDGDRLIQVLLNLLSNAVKYSPAQTMVTVVAFDDGGTLEIGVQDQGRGIPEEFKDKVFERFKQVKTSDVRTGTGLGLPICKMIVEAHGGTIGVDSKVGQGSRFWFRLPAGGRPPVQDRKTPVVAAASVALPKQAPSGDLRKRNRFADRFANISMWKKGAILVGVPVVFITILCGSLGFLLWNSFSEQQRENHERLVAQYSADLMLAHYVLGFSISLPGPENSWREFDKASKDGLMIERRLIDLTANDPRQKRMFDDLLRQFEVVNAFARHAHEVIARDGGPTEYNLPSAYDHRDQLLRFASDAVPAMQELADLANSQGDQSPAKLDRLRRQQGELLVAGLITSMLICGLSAALFSQGIVSRLRVMEDNVRRLEDDQPLNEALPGRDEVAHLDEFFHSMAGALHEARHKEKAVFDNCQDVICTVRADGVVSSINHASLAMWGYEPEEIIGKSIFEITADAQSAARAFELVAGGGGDREQESTVIRQNGTDCDVLWSLSWSQQQRAIVAIAHDISQRKELERLKQEFLAMVSHDMRTPLSSISVTTEMLCAGAMGPLPEKAEQQLQVVVRNCDRLLVLINDLLDIEKLEAGQMQMSMQPVEAGQIWQRTAEALESSAQEKNINIVVEVPAGLMVQADPDRLVQVGVNLLSNAIKFSQPQSAVKLAVKALPGFVEFSVCDTGRGIPESQLDAIFERFRQVTADDGKRSAGTGLGLPICKQIVAQHGGQIGVTSAPGWGSTFYFRIPAAERVVAPNA